MNIEFDVKGLDQFISKIDRAVNQIDEEIYKTTQKIGREMTNSYKSQAPKKTGKFVAQLKGRTLRTESGSMYKLQSTKQWGNGIFVMNEKGTRQRFRKRLRPNQRTFKKAPYSTGMVQPKNLSTRVRNQIRPRYKQAMFTTIRNFMKGDN